jgi:chromosome segregation ATPase
MFIEFHAFQSIVKFTEFCIFWHARVCRQGQREEIVAAERRSALLAGEIEELRAQIDVLEKTRKMVEGELHEAADRIADLTASNSSLAAIKKKLETDLQALHVSSSTELFNQCVCKIS